MVEKKREDSIRILGLRESVEEEWCGDGKKTAKE